MKKLHLLKTMLLLCALIVGSSSVWAASVDITPTQALSGGVSPITIVCAKGDGTSNPQISSGQLRLYQAASGKTTGNTMTFSSDKTITSIKFTFANSMTADNGAFNEGSYDSETFTWSGSTKSVTLTVTGTTSGKRIYITAMTVTYEITKTDPTITFNNGSVHVGQNLDLSTLFSSNSEGTVSYSITAGGSYASLVGSTLTGVAEGSVTVKAEQAEAGDYNAGEAIATITVNPAKVLSSIAVTTAPTKTTYQEGELFDPTGMVVTATYTDESTDDVTSVCSFTPSGALTTSDDKITISYTENAVNKTTTQDITVLTYVQPKIIDATFNNEFLGVEAGTRISEETTITQDNVDFVFDKISGSNWPQGDANVIRIYKGTTLQIKAPTGYVLTNITFTNNGDWKDGMEADKGTYDDTRDGDNKTYWTGFVNDVTFSPGGTHRIASVKVVIAQTATISLNAACNDGEGNIYGTYSNSKSFVVPADLTVSAVKVVDGKLVVTNYNEDDIVPANTGVMVSSTEAGDYTILLSDEAGEEISGNMLKASSVAMTGENLFYRLTMHNGEQIGFWWGAADGAAFGIAANKAYLAVPSDAGARDFVWFDEGETTSLREIRNEELGMKNAEYFNLNGQRVAQPTKGLYIVNGRKVVIK